MDHPVRQMPWDSPQGVYRLATHHKSFGELRNSAKTGCRTCETFWLYTMAVTQAKVDDDCELELTWNINQDNAQITLEIPPQSSATGERCTMNKISVARIDVEFEHYVYLRRGEVHSIPCKSNWGILSSTLKS
jgi:hypothetical protein